MNPALKRKLNAHIEFVASSHPARFEAAELAKEILAILSFPEQNAVLIDTLTEAARAWINGRIAHAKPEQLPFPDFPHVPPIIRVGRQHAVAFEHATAKEVESYFRKLVGFVSQQSFGSGVLFRVDVPDLLKEGKKVREGFTRYFGLSAIYSITPCTEAMVRQLLPGIDGTPGEARPLSLHSFSRDYEE
jgi:hypothetical protein